VTMLLAVNNTHSHTTFFIYQLAKKQHR